MSENLEPLSPLDLCINLVNARIGEYRRAEFLGDTQKLPTLFENIVQEVQAHSREWDGYVLYMKELYPGNEYISELLGLIGSNL